MENKINTLVEKEKTQSEPCVVCCITMGKEPHAGHMMLLGIAEQMRSGLESQLPVVLINNNTGPRTAGALVKAAKDNGRSLNDMAFAMNQGELSINEVVSAYRSRMEYDDMAAVEKIIIENKLDVFSVISSKTKDILNDSGYNVEIVSGSELQGMSTDLLGRIDSNWSGTGFLPIVKDKRIVLLEKSGVLTSTGVLFSSLNSVSNLTNSRLMVVVDGQPEVADASFALSCVNTGLESVQVAGAAVGFNEKIASGTEGQAITMRELYETFSVLRPGSDLKKAIVYLTLNYPLTFEKGSVDIKNSFYNFKNNQQVIEMVVKASDELQDFNRFVVGTMEELAQRVGIVSGSVDDNSGKFLNYLPSKASALLAGDKKRVLSESKKLVGGVRQNYYYNQLRSILNSIEGINTLTEDQFLTIGKMLQFCIERIGI